MFGTNRDSCESRAQSSTTDISTFDLLLDMLKDGADATSAVSASIDLDPSSRAICMLIAQYIQSNPQPLLPELISGAAPVNAKIEILIILARGTDACSYSKDNTEYLSDTLVQELLVSLAQPYLQRRCGGAPIFSRLPLTKVVPGLVDTLSGGIGEGAASAAATSIDQMIASAQDPSGVVEAVVEALCRIEIEEGLHEVKKLQKCIAHAGKWRRSLLSNNISVYHYSIVVEAVARSMFRTPSLSAPLSLFGEILGDGSDVLCYEHHDDIERCRKLLRVAQTTIELGLQELVRTASLAPGNRNEKELLYVKLSPILMLRRVPQNYFKLLHKRIDIAVDKEIVLQLKQLGDELIARLNFQKDSVTPEEKRLCAELVGRVLPFYLHKSSRKHGESAVVISSFDRMFMPAFSKMLRLMSANSTPVEQSQSGNTRKNEIDDALRESRTVLYAACHHVHLIDDTDPGAALLATVAFAVYVISLRPDMMALRGSILGFDRLKTGCMDFLAFCVESWCNRRASRRSTGSTQHVNALIQELSRDPNMIITPWSSNSEKEEKSNQLWNRNVLDTLSYTIDVAMSISLKGVPPRSWRNVECWFFSLFGGLSFFEKTDCSLQERCIGTRVCCINALSLASQRCLDEDEGLKILAQRIMPTFVLWGRSMRKLDGDHIYHPLCVAAAQHTAFILITKSKTLECCVVREHLATMEVKDGIRILHKWALEAARSQHFDSNGTSEDITRAVTTMRMAGLKLMLALVTIDQLTFHHTDQGHQEAAIYSFLGPGELGETISFLHGASNVDQSVEIRSLATHILRALHAYS